VLLVYGREKHTVSKKITIYTPHHQLLKHEPNINFSQSSLIQIQTSLFMCFVSHFLH